MEMNAGVSVRAKIAGCGLLEKARRRSAIRGRLLGLACASGLAASPVFGATAYTWDTAAAGTAVTTGAGTWTTATGTTNWTTDNGATKTFWADGNDANFGPAAVTITLGTDIVANSVNFANAGSTANTVQLSGGKNLDTAVITTTNYATVDLTNVISGNHGLSITSTGSAGNQGRVNFKSANTYTGDTTIGTNAYVTAVVNDTLPTATNLTMGTGSTFRFTTANVSQHVAGLIAAGSATINSSGTANVFTVATALNTSTTYAGAMTGNLGLVVSGSGTQVLSGTASSYNGSTTIGGTAVLSVGTLNNGASNSSIGASTNVAGNLILNGGTLRYTGAAVSTDRLFSLQSSSTIDASGATTGVKFTNTGAMGFNGSIADKTLTLTGSNVGANTLFAAVADNTGKTGITKTGAGAWTLSGTNTYTGATNVNVGSLTVSSTGSLSGTSTAVANGASFNLNGGGVYGFDIGASGIVNGAAAPGLSGNGAATLSGAFNFNLANAGTTAGNSWTIVDAVPLNETYNGFSVANAGATQAGGIWSFSNAGTGYQFAQSTGVLSVVVPEPTSIVLASLGAIGYALRRRCREGRQV